MLLENECKPNFIPPHLLLSPSHIPTAPVLVYVLSSQLDSPVSLLTYFSFSIIFSLEASR